MGRNEDRVGPAVTTKRQRARLARAELLMFLASTAERWSHELAGDETDTLPFSEWKDDPFVDLARTYELTGNDLAKLCHGLGDDLERRSIRAGFDEHWDAKDTSGVKAPRNARRGNWSYGNHEGLNPGWRLDGTNLVLDFDRSNTSCGAGGSDRGCYVLWRDGQEDEPIDRHLAAAMDYVEATLLWKGQPRE